MGLFTHDYSRPGPGVSKDADASKRGVVKFFELYFRSFWKTTAANLLFVLLALPVVTNGLASAGLAYITRSAARDRHTFVASDFFDTIKKNWKQALPTGIINLLITALLFYNLWFSYVNFTGILRMVYMGVTVLFIVVFSFAKYYHYLQIITFDFKLTKIYKNSLIFAFLGFKRNIAAAVPMLVCYGVAFCAVWWLSIGGLVIDTLLYVFFFPAFRSYLIQYNAFPVIKKHIIDPYYKEHPDDDIEKRREIGVYEEPVIEEIIFEDAPADNEEK